MSFNIGYEEEMKEDFIDIRFTDENDALLPYWIESTINSSEAKVWVKIPVIDETDGSIVKMYYGNSSVSSVENGENVFELFDNFDGTSLNTSKWSVNLQSGGDLAVSNSILHLDNPVEIFSTQVINSNTTTPYEVVFKSRLDNLAYGCSHIGFMDPTLSDMSSLYHYRTGRYYTRSINSSSSAYSRWPDNEGLENEYHKWHILWNSGSNASTSVESGTIYSVVENVTAVPLNVGINTRMDTIYDHDSKVWTDWIYVRKCIENEPTYSISNLSTGNDYGYTSDATAGNVYFTYDSLGRKIAMNDPDMGNWTYEYDLNGNLINQTDARGISTLLSYDALDRLTAIDYPNDDDVSFTYDLQYNGTLSQVTRGNVSSSYDYDQRYRVENETVTLDGTGYTTSYEYDSMDRPTTITYPDGNSVNLTYNAQTLLESVEGVVDNLDYNARNQITTKELSNGVVTSYTYDAEKLLLDRIYTESLQDLNYDFDNVGNILEIEDNVLNSVKTYGYDDLDRLTSADMSVNSVSTYQRDFIYDQYGCIQQVNENDVTISSYEYNLTPFHAPDTYNGNILDYDANGNLVEDEDFTYTYNDANQLSEVHYAGNSSLVEKYWYDANGQRVKKQNYAGEFTYYVNQFYEIENGTATSYFFRDDERIAKETSGDMEWYLSDHLGSTTLLINESGLEVERTEYYPYGEVQSGGLEKYGFTGQENDADTELMYYGARYYSPQYRIFVQPDTMLPDPYNPQALNRYAYTLNNPMKYTDPTGHYVESGIDIAFIAMDLNDIRTGNADKWTYIGLATDVVCLALPGATGGRLAVTAVEEGVTHADNVGDLFKFLDKTLEAEVNINRVDNVNDAFKTLDWGSYVRKGEKREEHVMLHATDNLDKSLHGIFNGDPIQMTNDAWANKGNIEPILDRGDDVYYIPYENAGIEGGARGSGETLNYIKVVTVTGTNKIITAYPSKLPE